MAWGFKQKDITHTEELKYGLPARVFSILYILVLILTPVCSMVGWWREDAFGNCDASLIRMECFGNREYLADWGNEAWPTGKQTNIAVIGLVTLVFDSVVRVSASIVCIACGHPDIGISHWAAFASSLLGFVTVLTVGVGWKLDDNASDGWGFYCCLVQAILDLLIGIVLLCIWLLRRKKKKPRIQNAEPGVIHEVPWQPSPPRIKDGKALELGPDSGLQVAHIPVAVQEEPLPPERPAEWRHASTFNKRQNDKTYEEFGGGLFGTKGELIHHNSIQNTNTVKQSFASIRQGHNYSPAYGYAGEQFGKPIPANPLDETFFQQPQSTVAVESLHAREADRRGEMGNRLGGL